MTPRKAVFFLCRFASLCFRIGDGEDSGDSGSDSESDFDSDVESNSNEELPPHDFFVKETT